MVDRIYGEYVLSRLAASLKSLLEQQTLSSLTHRNLLDNMLPCTLFFSMFLYCSQYNSGHLLILVIKSFPHSLIPVLNRVSFF